MSDTAELRVKIGADRSELDKVIKGLSKNMDDVGKRLQGLGKTFSIAGAAITGSLGLLIKKTANLGDTFNDLSQRTGIATSLLSSYKLAADSSGTSLEGFANGMRGLVRAMAEATSDGSAAAKAFAEIGVSTTDASGKTRDLNEVFLDVAERLSKMEDGGDKAALAMQLFGKSGMDLIPMLNEGKTGLKAFAERARELGLVFSQEDAKASDAFNDALESLKGSLMGIVKALTTSVIPYVQKFVEYITNAIAKVREWADAHPQLIGFLSKAAVFLGVATTAAGIFNGTIGTLLRTIAKLPALLTVITGPAGLVAAALAAVVWSINELVTTFKRAKGEMSDIANRAAADTSANMELLTRSMMLARERGGAALEELKKITFDYGKDAVGAFVAITQSNAFPELLKILEEVKVGTVAAKIESRLMGSAGFVPAAKDAETLAKSLETVVSATDATKQALTAMTVDGWQYARGGIIGFIEELQSGIPVEEEFTETVIEGGEEMAQSLIDSCDVMGFAWSTASAEGKKAAKDIVPAWQEAIQKIQGALSQLGYGFSDLFASIGALWAANADAEQQRMDEDYERRKKAIEDSLMSEEEKAAALIALEEEYNAQSKTAKQKAFKDQQKVQIAQALISTALAVVNALATVPFFPLGLAMAALATASGAVQVAAIKNQPVPLAEGGIILNQPTLSKDGGFLAGEAGPEAVIPLTELGRYAAMSGSGTGSAAGSSPINLTAEVYIGAEKLDERIVRVVTKNNVVNRLSIARIR